MTHSQPQGFLAVPPTGKGPGVLVLHAWWGLNDTLKAFCMRLAEAGFVAFAPDLYHGKVADTIPDAEALGKALDANYHQARAEVAEATRFLNERVGSTDRGLAAIGFSLGASYALDISNTAPESIRSVVIFYGTWVDDLSKSRAAYLGHFAENDPFEPQSNVDRLEEYIQRMGRPVTFHRYPRTGHWFFEPDRSDAYNREAATLAWERTLTFLQESRGVLMNESAVVDYIMKTFPEVETTKSFGYDMFFYRSDRKLSFATMISSDYEYDHVSNLNRPGVFRLNIGISKETFQSLFGTTQVDAKNYDFTALDVIMPHPEYAQYHFICVLSPSEATFERLRPLLAEAYDIAVRRYTSQNKDQ